MHDPQICLCILCNIQRNDLPLGRQLTVYTQKLNTVNYLYQHGLPAMSEISLCFQLKMENVVDRKLKALISMAVPGYVTFLLT